VNCYEDLATIKDDLSISGTGDDTRLLALLEAASRAIDNFCDRHFYVKSETRYFDGQTPLFVDDLLSVTTLKTDEDGDATFENTFASTDYILYPLNTYPKTKIELSADSDYGSFGYTKKGCEIDGVWGYGDGKSATPYTDSGDTVQDDPLSSSATTLNVSSGDNFAAGQTLLIESEQLYVSAISANALTVTRGINGTTAAEHAQNKKIYIYDYPADIEQACLMIASRLFQTRGKAMASETLGDYSYKMANVWLTETERALLRPYRRLHI